MSEPATLYLMRHGAPVLERRLLGRTDCDVTDAGVAACVRQASGLEPSRLISSDLRRAVRCGQSIAALHDLKLEQNPRWRELDFGEWDGLPASDVDPAALSRFWDDPDASPPPGGERWSQLSARVEAAITDLAAVPTLIVTHGGAIRAALSALCGIDQRQGWAFDLPYACLLTIRWWPEAPRRGQVTALTP